MLEVVLLILVAIPALLGGLAVHEFGHLLAGRLAGLRMAFFVAGPVQMLSSEDGWRLAWNTRLELYGGMVACVPASTEGLRRPYAWFIAGGPLISLICGLASLGLFYGLEAFEAESGPGFFLGFALFLFGAVSLGVGFVTLIPNALGGMASDGKRLLGLRKTRYGSAERNAAVIALGSYAMAGQRPETWSEVVVQQALSVPDGSYQDMLANHLAYLYALDRGFAQQALPYLQRAIECSGQAPPSYLPGLWLEVAYFNAAYAGDAAAARRWLSRATEAGAAEGVLRSRAEAALLLLDGQQKAARQTVALAYQQLEREIDRGMIASIRSELEKLEAGQLPEQAQPAL